MMGSVLWCVLLGMAVATCDGMSLSWFGGGGRETHSKTYSLPRSTNYVMLNRHRREVVEPATITSLKIVSQVSSRFSETVVTSIVTNPTTNNRDASFSLSIPETAFISNFTMLIDGELIITDVKSKEEADRLYDEARESNKTAGKVSSSQPTGQEIPGMERFDIAITIKAESTIEFELTYLQLLERVNGVYEQIISLRPGQIVPEFEVDVFIYDSQGVEDLSVFEPSLGTNTLEYEMAEVEKVSEYLQHVAFHPTVEQQRQMDADMGVNKELAVSYEVRHGDNGGLLEVEGEYFAHYFSPDDNYYHPLPKHVVFVIDISGSMGSGNKMQQTRDAFDVIIGRLRSQDTFMLLLFDDKLEYWPGRDQVVPANAQNIAAARDFARRNLYPDSSTNIADALVAACGVLRGQRNSLGSDLVFFLTDGEPTAGETHPDRIVGMVTDAAAGRVAVHSLAIGDSVNFELLQKLAFRTGGDAYRVYERNPRGENGGSGGVQAQLEEFFARIESPIMYDVDVIYPGDAVNIESVTQTSYNQHFRGSELVIVGKVIEDYINQNSPDNDDGNDELDSNRSPVAFEATVTGLAKKLGGEAINEISLVTTSIEKSELPPATSDLSQSTPEGFIEKLYVYLRIKHLLKELLITDNDQKKADLEQEALQLALQYRLVTPLTSMIIVQPDQDQALGGEEMMDVPAYGNAMSGSPGLKGVGLNLSVCFASVLCLCLQALL